MRIDLQKERRLLLLRLIISIVLFLSFITWELYYYFTDTLPSSPVFRYVAIAIVIGAALILPSPPKRLPPDPSDTDSPASQLYFLHKSFGRIGLGVRVGLLLLLVLMFAFHIKIV